MGGAAQHGGLGARAVGAGDTIAALAGPAAADHGPGGARAAVLRLLWERRLTADLDRPLDGGSVLEAAGG